MAERARSPIAAAAVVRNVRAVAPTLDVFQGTYTIHEFGLSREVPERLFDMEVAFRSPQRFRLYVHDLTTIIPSLDPDPPPIHPGRDHDVHVGSLGVLRDLPAHACPERPTR